MLSPNLPIFPICQLIEEHGTPLLIGDRLKVRSQIALLREELAGVSWFYAVKANDQIDLLKTICDEGLGFDIASIEELRRVQEANSFCRMQTATNPILPPIVHSHPCKAPVDLKQCYRQGIRRFVFDCQFEASKLAEYAPESECLLRINVPGNSSSVKLSNRFGADLKEVESLLAHARSLNLRLVGLAFHIGSQAIDPVDFDVALCMARKAWDIAVSGGFPLDTLDIGGGFPIAYRDQKLPSLREYCRKIRISLERRFGDLNITVMAEPGRVVCAEAMWLITSIIGKQFRNERWWYTIDDGRYGTFSGRYFTEKCFDFFPLRESRTDVTPSMIVGPTCDGGDIVATDYMLPNLEIGDMLVVPNVGAYCAVGATRFNGMPLAKQIWFG